jgi:hypothetical protein
MCVYCLFKKQIQIKIASKQKIFLPHLDLKMQYSVS